MASVDDRPGKARIRVRQRSDEHKPTPRPLSRRPFATRTRRARRSCLPRPGLVFPEGYLPGRSPAILELYAEMRPLLLGDMPALLLGETGVGKEQLAHILHASSRRREGPFVAVNCAAIPTELLEAEMFGIGRGVATGVTERRGKFQLAEGGTLFLDEIGEMPRALQAKLLRALQGKEIQPVGGLAVPADVRVIAATNSDLDRRMHDGEFRRDLYYRLAGLVLSVPPLRERREDIPELVELFLLAATREVGRSIRGITAEAQRALALYPWPGNVRELEHEVRRLAYLCPEGQEIQCGMLSERILNSSGLDGDLPLSTLDLESNLERLERRLIKAALGRSSGKRAAAARLLGISRNGLAIKMERLGLACPGVESRVAGPMRHELG